MPAPYRRRVLSPPRPVWRRTMGTGIGAPPSGLTLVGGPGGVTVTSAGVALGTTALPSGACTLALASDPSATTVALDGTPVLTHPGDVRPDVAGIFTEAPSGTEGLSLSL